MERNRLLDVLRGLAIIGTLGTNIWIFSMVDNLEETFDENSLDAFIQNLFFFITNGKFLGLLTILFGAGLELKRQKNQLENKKWLGVYVWSCILLFVDGILHYIFVFEADILMSYALTAVIVAIILEKKEKIAKWIAWILGSLHVIVVFSFSVIFGLLFHFDEDAMVQTIKQDMQEMSSVYLSGSYIEQILYRFEYFIDFRIEAILIIPFNICLFILGSWLVRSGYFAPTDKGREKRKKLLKWGLGLGVPFNALIFIPPLAEFSLMAVRYIFAPILSLGYIGLISYLLDKASQSYVIRSMEKIGRVALSCYILQNIIATILFYGWGFGLGANSNTWIAVAAWLLISLFMTIFAHFWLSFFKQGPFEYVWRKATYFRSK